MKRNNIGCLFCLFAEDSTLFSTFFWVISWWSIHLTGFLENLPASNQLLIPHDFRISGERQMTIWLNVWDQCSRCSTHCYREIMWPTDYNFFALAIELTGQKIKTKILKRLRYDDLLKVLWEKISFLKLQRLIHYKIIKSRQEWYLLTYCLCVN